MVNTENGLIISFAAKDKEVLTVNKRIQNAVPGCNLKNDRMILVSFQGKSFSITESKSMLQPLMQKKLKLNSSMKTYKTFLN